jgi:WD40 repeat protein
MASLALCIGAAAYYEYHPELPSAGDLASSVTLLGTIECPGTATIDEISSLAVSPDGSLLATGTRAGVVQLWRTADRGMISQWQAHTELVTALAFSPDSQALLTCGSERTVHRWLLAPSAAPTLVSQWPGPGLVTAAACADDGRTAAFAVENQVELRDVNSGERTAARALAFPSGPIWSLTFAPDGRTLAGGGGRDLRVFVWALGDEPRLERSLEIGRDGAVRGLTYTADGSTLLCLETAGGLHAWDRTGEPLAEIAMKEAMCFNVAFGGAGRHVLVSSTSDHGARLYGLPERWQH